MVVTVAGMYWDTMVIDSFTPEKGGHVAGVPGVSRSLRVLVTLPVGASLTSGSICVEEVIGFLL